MKFKVMKQKREVHNLGEQVIQFSLYLIVIKAMHRIWDKGFFHVSSHKTAHNS